MLSAKEKRLEKFLYDWKDCRRCVLGANRNKIVFYKGNVDSNIMFIGEAPGADEDLQGIPFVGKSGQLLDDVFFEITSRNLVDETSVTNVVSCRPPRNRTPKLEEIICCKKRLFWTVKIISPKIIIALGSVASKRIAGVRTISSWRGNVLYSYVENERDVVLVKVMPTYHPSFVLRAGKSSKEYDEFASDIKVACKIGGLYD